MFTRLRNKFLILNMALISIVMIGAFVVIYLSTYNNIRLENKGKLASMLLPISGGQMLLSKPIAVGRTRVTVEQVLSFQIIVDSKGRLSEIISFIDMPDEIYEKAAGIAWSNNTDGEIVNLNGRKWQYAIQKADVTISSNNGRQLMLFRENEDKNRIVFLDITDSQKRLSELLTTLLVVGLVMLFAILIISYFFAGRAIKPISEAWEKQKQFITDASHELKTPLTIITSNYDALLSVQDETIKSQLKWFYYMKTGTDRMAKLINDLLTLSRMENRELQLEGSEVNISEEGNALIASMEAAIIKKNIALSLSIEPDVIVNSNRDEIRQVIAILLDNAVKYTNEAGRISISLSKSKSHAIFFIKNDGKEIPDQDLSKIFDRFYRTDPSRTGEAGGYGLGLSIAKTVINNLGGNIFAEKDENGMTIFTFMLKGIVAS